MQTKEEARASRKGYDAYYHHAHKEGRNAYSAAYKAEHRDAIREKNRQDFAEFHEWLQLLRTVNGCADCETHEGLLEHHHLDPSTKLYEISQMYLRPIDALEEELEKCAVLCRYCHAKRHAIMRSCHEQIVA